MEILNNEPKLTSDPRFRGGRVLIESGKPEEATTMFGSLLEVRDTKACRTCRYTVCVCVCDLSGFIYSSRNFIIVWEVCMM